MSEGVKIYQVETLEDYDDLMVKLEEQGYRWRSGDKPTSIPQYWSLCKKNTCILLNSWRDSRLTKCSLEYAKKNIRKCL